MADPAKHLHNEVMVCLRSGTATTTALVVTVMLCAPTYGAPGPQVAESSQWLARTSPAGPRTTLATNRFRITGMKCKDCAKGLAAELRLSRGILRTTVSQPKAEAVVVYDTNQIRVASVLKVIEEAGFKGSLLP